MLPFDTVAGQQPEWDHRLDLTPGLRVVQVFTATEDDLSRIEVFLVPDEDGADTGLRFALWEGGDADAIAAEPLRASRPGDAVPIHGPGWFSFDFTPVAASRGRVYTLGVEAGGGVALMAHRGLGSRLKVAGRGVAGSITFRAVARRAPGPREPTSIRCARASRRSRRGSIKGRCTSGSRSPRRATSPASCARSASRAATAPRTASAS